MQEPNQEAAVRRFGAFEINLDSGELRKHGIRLRLSGQPFQVLAVLVERAGDVVTREELHSKLWQVDTFVDFDHGLNNAVARIREVLEDSSGTPRYVETIPRRGYRFIAPLDARRAIISLTLLSLKSFLRTRSLVPLLLAFQSRPPKRDSLLRACGRCSREQPCWQPSLSGLCCTAALSRVREGRLSTPWRYCL